MNYTDEEVNNLLKPALLKYCIDLRKANAEIVAENVSLKESINSVKLQVKSLETIVNDLKKKYDEVAVTSNDNRLYELEKQVFSNSQYSRRDTLEVVGIEESVNDDKLEDKVIEIFSDIDVTINSTDIQACHRLSDKKRTIVKFANRKSAQKILMKRKELSTIDAYKKKVYINESLCSYYRFLHRKCKQLWKEEKLFQFWVSNGTVRYRLQDRGNFTIVRHINELENVFGKLSG